MGLRRCATGLHANVEPLLQHNSFTQLPFTVMSLMQQLVVHSTGLYYLHFDLTTSNCLPFSALQLSLLSIVPKRKKDLDNIT